MRLPRLIVLLFVILASPGLAFAQSDFTALVDALGQGGFPERTKAIDALVATGDERVPPILLGLSDGNLYVRKSDAKVVFAAKAGADFALTDPADGTDLGTAASADIERIRVNNGLRTKIRTAIGTMTLLSPDRDIRMSAAESILKNADPAMLELLDKALAAETDSKIKTTMELARAVIVLKTDGSIEEKRAAVNTIVSHGNRAAQTVLVNTLATAPDELKPLIQSGIDSISNSLAIWDVGQNLLYGISLSSVLLLAAIGLAITFGVMGIINMAHGEMVMLGAYTTYVVQNVIAQSAPGLMEYSLVFAVPAAFLFTGLVGVGIERSVIRWLYGRPLETLLATWGLSLILQQAVRSIFGPTNKLVTPPILDERHLRRRQHQLHLEPALDHRLRHRRLRDPADRAQAHAARPADAGGHGQPPHGLVDGHPHALRRCHDLRARLGHRRHRRRGAQPDRQCLAQSRPGLHHRLLHGRGVRRRRQSVGDAGRRRHAWRRQQVPRALCRARSWPRS